FAAFLPAYSAVLFINDLITAVLLFSLFSILRTRALLLISSGYIFTALMVILWILTFPGLFRSGGIIGGLQSTPWIHFIWHGGFPIFVIGYALLKDTNPQMRFWRGKVSTAIAMSMALTISLVFLVGVLCIVGEPLLPQVQLTPLRLSPLWLYVGIPAVSLNILALSVLLTRRWIVLDLWLMVVMLAYAMELSLSYFPQPLRYTFGWYAGRTYGLIASSAVLILLLREITSLYSRLLRAVLAQQRERQARLVTGDAVAATIAHEVKQPLTGMITNADAGLNWLDGPSPDIDEARATLQQIIADGHRASAVIDSVRSMFKSEVKNRTSLDLQELIEEALSLSNPDLLRYRISVETSLITQLPRVGGDRIQILQVLLNLISNAIDSMAATKESRTLRICSKPYMSNGVLVLVADTGTGIASLDVERVFNPLYTTKSGGMGMGLPICRAIVEAHGGRLWATPNTPRGAAFQFFLPVQAAVFASASQPDPQPARAGASVA
ncbi:MAG: MASE4 domain-containing protein, partial [Alphaproteobacteria bacterium]|nr:MASE4 domain-containing protein [Alphaproteobacteria bacterium]